MGWFTRRKQNARSITTKVEYSRGEELNDDKVHIPKDKFVLEQKVLEDIPEMPIYGIYRRLQEDWETKGYKDSIAFPESSYREKQKRIIIENLRLAIKQTLTKYEDMIADLECHIKQAETNGLVETLNKYNLKREKLLSHHEDLVDLDTDAKEVGDRISPILTSYDVGFMRGMTFLSDEKVNQIMNAINNE